ncbi:flagellar basal body-associated FliL family protein [Ectothiorhodospira lacustris]|uniref:flagellar basal body-associated FliL family protein n=1 Tax=Ectothiorhodospira lacustris TaxID=2899127 RepID=UPI001EE993E8|nr:flagellar basal body-associated FliL family protein [Ectothiorhodospira lacustris]MCG5499524.1 flagellar basal body-associated FliL family protein [Ectothiorhodospira lacustris]MCG5511102.1 flagellar basal body-associated FliL family protein [Ectothiorhodospira lacustris]MCG5522890.1 flagellar basal body-associated FliL family protein [Ectothiorhodospira lacustris]
MAKKPEKTAAAAAKPAKGKGGLWKLILIVLLTTLVAAGAGGGIAWYLLGSGEPGEERPEPERPAIYLPLDPPLVVNFQGSGRIRFVQVGIVLMARDQAVLDGVTRHMPVIRNNLMMLIGNKTYEDLITQEGKELARAEVLAEVINVLETRGELTQVEAVYFNSLVMQ